MAPAWWIETPYPKSTTSEDLIGTKLVLDPEKPPEDTSFSGMKMVFVKKVTDREPKTWNVYKVLMTEKDITTAIMAMEQHKLFTYEKAKGAKFASVEVV